MSRILVIGTGPLFSPDVKMLNGQALRTWHLTKPLIEAGHAVDLAVLPTEGHSESGQLSKSSLVQTTRVENHPVQVVTTSHPERAFGAIQGIFDQKPYDVVVGVNLNASLIGAALKSDKPFWADLNGYTMGEGQTKCAVYESDEWLRHFWSRQRAVLRRADFVSAVSVRQRIATLAELATIGRMNRYTFNHSFCAVIPNAVSEYLVPPGSATESAEPQVRKYRGVVFPERTFAVLWTGGFNTWTDVDMLAGALSLGMEQSPNLRFVCSGGAIPGHDELSFKRFQERMAQTGFLDRCHFLGWVESGDLQALHRECDLAVSVDSKNFETYFGARNRITNWMGLGIPFVTTLGTEISEIVEENLLGYVVHIGNVHELATVFGRAERNLAERRQYAARARKFAHDHFSYAATTKALVRWASDPKLAPDNAVKAARNEDGRRLDEIHLNELEVENAAMENNLVAEVTRLRAELQGIRANPLYRIYKAFGG